MKWQKQEHNILRRTSRNQKLIQPDQQLAAQPTDEEIAVRAYHIYLERGGDEGNPDDDWLQAKT